MALIYSFLESLPFSVFQYDFMKNAFLAVIFIAPLFALLGSMTVNNKMAFFSDALGHSAFTGIGIGVLLGLGDPLLAMIGFGIFLSLLIRKVKASHMLSSDTVISVFASTAMALGIVVLSMRGGFAKYSSYLVGDILTVRPTDIFLIIGVFIAAHIFWYFFYNKLLLVSINPSLAASRGVAVGMIESLFVALVAVAVMVSIRWIGVLMINSLLILPAAAARNVTRSACGYHWLAVAIALFSSLMGLFISFSMGTSAGASMVLVASCCFAITYQIGRKQR